MVGEWWLRFGETSVLYGNNNEETGSNDDDDSSIGYAFLLL